MDARARLVVRGVWKRHVFADGCHEREDVVLGQSVGKCGTFSESGNFGCIDGLSGCDLDGGRFCGRNIGRRRDGDCSVARFGCDDSDIGAVVIGTATGTVFADPRHADVVTAQDVCGEKERSVV